MRRPATFPGLLAWVAPLVSAGWLGGAWRGGALLGGVVLVGGVLGGCGEGQPGSAEVAQWRPALDANCQIQVRGVGTLDLEGDYLPNVVNCENGGASFEALKVQAVAARTYAYYKIATSGSVADGTGDQVYSCGRSPSQAHVDAVNATSGQVLTYAGHVIAAFFVAGAKQDPPECQGGNNDPTNTERFVTYNEGLSGDAIHQTTLGFVDPSNTANRGCMSQNGSDCLAHAGRTYDDILRFYYGADIGLETAVGSCVTPPPPPPPPPPGPDGGVDPGPDAAPAADADPPPPPAFDASVTHDGSTPPPPPPPPAHDGGVTFDGARGLDAARPPAGSDSPAPPDLQGGCAQAPARRDPGLPGALLLLGAVLAVAPIAARGRSRSG